MFRWLVRAYLVLLILNLVDNVMCIIMSGILKKLFYFPSLQDTIAIVLLAPQVVSTKYMFVSFDLLRSIFILLSIIFLVIYISDSSKKAVVYYEVVIVVAYITYVLWAIIEGYTLSTFLGDMLSIRFNVVGLVLLFLIILIYHMPFATIAGVLYSIINRYRIVSSELEIVQGA